MQARKELPPERLHGRIHRQHDPGVHFRRPAEAAGEPERELDGGSVDMSKVDPRVRFALWCVREVLAARKPTRQLDGGRLGIDDSGVQ